MELMLNILFFGVLVVAIGVSSWNKKAGLHPWMLPIAFALKCAVGWLFLQFYVFQHADAHRVSDAGAFFHEAQILNTVYDKSPSDYFTLMSGIGDTEALSDKYLGATNHWDSGKQAIFNDNRNIIRVHALMRYISMGSIGIHMLLFCLLSFFGTVLLFLSLRGYSALKPWVIFALLLLFPNLLFWSSGILKEPIILFGMGALAYGVTRSAWTIHRVLFLLLGAIALLCFKPYIIIALVLASFIYLIYTRAPKAKLILAVTIPLVLCGAFVALFPDTVQKGTHILSRKQFDFSNVGRGGMHVRVADKRFYYFSPEQVPFLRQEGDSVWLTKEMDACKVTLGDLVPPQPIHLSPNSVAWKRHFYQERAGSFIEISPIDDQPIRLITTAPEAVFNAMLRPFPWDPGGKLKYIAFLETLFLFSLLIWTVLRPRKLTSNERGFILSIIAFSLMLALLIGWTTPVLGAIHRYRFPIQLALLCSVIVAWKPNFRKLTL